MWIRISIARTNFTTPVLSPQCFPSVPSCASVLTLSHSPAHFNAGCPSIHSKNPVSLYTQQDDCAATCQSQPSMPYHPLTFPCALQCRVSLYTQQEDHAATCQSQPSMPYHPLTFPCALLSNIFLLYNAATSQSRPLPPLQALPLNPLYSPKRHLPLSHIAATSRSRLSMPSSSLLAPPPPPPTSAAPPPLLLPTPPPPPQALLLLLLLPQPPLQVTITLWHQGKVQALPLTSSTRMRVPTSPHRKAALLTPPLSCTAKLLQLTTPLTPRSSRAVMQRIVQ